ncbi:hypothetical protein ZIOFF_020383 [Zingiber officinale]|uniref:Mediator of RNA polymerase II transcription subunit 6 n=1 Tax=Zingiber officinale TaxID=94328 RepID=A0A8J5L7W5_ZINOF|nr:hypothetical protein ZIOFF_020383 [Zingiber officinale]
MDAPISKGRHGRDILLQPVVVQHFPPRPQTRLRLLRLSTFTIRPVATSSFDLDLKTTDTEYALGEVMEPHLFLIRKQKRNWQEKITLILAHYILGGSIYPAPQLASGFASRIGALSYIESLNTASLKSEKIGYGISLSFDFISISDEDLAHILNKICILVNDNIRQKDVVLINADLEPYDALGATGRQGELCKLVAGRITGMKNEREKKEKNKRWKQLE